MGRGITHASGEYFPTQPSGASITGGGKTPCARQLTERPKSRPGLTERPALNVFVSKLFDLGETNVDLGCVSGHLCQSPA
ncbi:hypothetical protein QC762_0087580 [Podospora pseudocomata]|uniref:Uncharacterized protein n=1 Tax=Podospora pseudocomata TaxID=2093779 RepID=A0ABR0GDJ5_9PEZI|nr:hypothetical protein QC762_0087580 [Podospora pseudocomata]